MSVVIPVWNPGTSIDRCIASLLAQTLSPAEFEVVFVDDGSTDGTSDRLVALAAEHPHVRTVRIPNSGWPGKPRNVGTDAARGQYVMFVDQDDALEPESLARLFAAAAGHGADVVLGKVTSNFRGVNHDLYRQNRPRCTVFDADLMNSLTPHKMLRTAFLREQGIRYPEGARRLEDQLFMTRAYFAAASASIVGDYVCYRYQQREDGQNAGSSTIEPAGYFANLREVLDVVDQHTEPGPQRDQFYRRFLRTEMLNRLGGKKLRAPRPDYYETLLVEVRRLMEERFPVSVDGGLGAVLRIRARLVREAGLAELTAHSRAVDRVRLETRVTHLASNRRAALVVGVEAWLVDGDEPLALEPGPGGGWLLPASLSGPGASEAERRLEPLEQLRGDVVVTDRRREDVWFVPGSLQPEVREVDGRGLLTWVGRARLNPASVAGGAGLPRGIHDLSVRVGALGLNRTRRLAVDPDADGAPPLLVGARGRLSIPVVTDQGRLALRVPPRPRRLTAALAGARVSVRPDSLGLTVPVRWARAPEDVRLTLQPVAGGPGVTWPASAEPGPPTAWVVRPPTDAARLAPGAYRLTLELRQGRVGRRPADLAVPLDQLLTLDAATTRQWWVQALRVRAARAVAHRRRQLTRVVHRS